MTGTDVDHVAHRLAAVPRHRAWGGAGAKPVLGDVVGHFALHLQSRALTYLLDVPESEALVAEVKSLDPAAREGFLREQLRAAFAEESARAGLALSEAEWSLLALDIDLNAQGLAVAAGR